MNTSDRIDVVQMTSAHIKTDSRIFYKECKSLARAGYRVHLITPAEKEEELDGVHIIPITRARGPLGRWIKGNLDVYRRARKINGAVYHFHDPELMLTGLALSAAGKKVVFDSHEDFPMVAHNRPYLPLWIRGIVSTVVAGLEKFCARRFAGIVSATPTIGAWFEQFSRNSVVLNNYPVLDDLDLLESVPWEQRLNQMTYIGSISLERGFLQMVEATGFIDPALKVTFELAGKISPVLEQRAEPFTGWQKTNRLGYLPRQAVHDLLARVKVGLVVLQPVERIQASQPLKMFEYMAAGVPVIASDFPLWRTFITDNQCGILVDPTNPKAIAQAVEYLITHPEEAEAMGKRGQKAILNQYHWGAEEKKLLAFYENLLKK